MDVAVRDEAVSKKHLSLSIVGGIGPLGMSLYGIVTHERDMLNVNAGKDIMDSFTG